MGLLDSLPTAISIYEVGLRDGLQNEATTVGTARKLRLLQALTDSGLRRIEITSFVSPRWIPQLADAEELCQLAPRVEGVQYSALCPNERGLRRAQLSKIDEIAVFVSASELHNRHNINRSIPETMRVFERLIPAAVAESMRVRAYISTVWGCPYQGEVDLPNAVALGEQLLGLGCYELSLGDTIGVGTPRQTADIIEAFSKQVNINRLAVHMHDTRGQALANVLIALCAGIATVDSAIGGLGGCPYAPGASGNLATEDLVYMLDNMGVETGVDLDLLHEAGRIASAVVARDLPGRVHRAGLRSLRG